MITNSLLRGGKKFCHLLLVQPTIILNPRDKFVKPNEDEESKD
jgi:hypothetical protein